MDKTSNLGLNLPDKGYRDWDIPINENFEILDTASGDVQEQLKGKQATITGAASTVTTSNLTASRALVSDSSGKVAVSAVTSTELGYLDGVTLSIQTQLNAKQTTANLSQTLDNSTTKYPSNAAVNTAMGVFTYDSSKAYALNDYVITYADEQTVIYRSKVVNNTAALTDENSWEKVSLGGGSGLEIGDIGFAPLGIDETQNKRRYLNGQVISQIQFATFADKVKAAVALYPSLSATEANWQAEVTNSKLGQCGKFVIDDTAGTIRLPKVVNINGLTDLSLMGGIKAESLPNITGELFWGANTGITAEIDIPQGAFYDKTSKSNFPSTKPGQAYTGGFDASRSSSAYKDNAPVQQEAVQYPYFIQVATGSEESVDISTEIQLNNPFFFGMHIWSDTAISNASWLISNGSYHSGATYVDFYEWLLKIHNRTLTVDGVSVKAYGASGITDYDFVLNTSDTTFRLPIKVKLASGNAVAGNGMTLGLTNGSDNIGLMSGTNNGYGAFALGNDINAYGKNIGLKFGAYSIPQPDKSSGITTDPTKSGIETSSSGLKLYFYVGETIQDAIVINAAGVLTRVANCIDRTVASDRETVVGWGIPDYSAGVEIPLSSLVSGYRAPVDSVFYINGQHSSGVIITVDNNYVGVLGGAVSTIAVRVKKGQVVKLSVTPQYSSPETYFPLQGVK